MLRIQAEALSVDEAVAAVRRPDCGAVCCFLGVVRNENRGRTVVRLEYSAFPEMALRELARIEAEARSRWKLGDIYVAHRTGTVRVGETSVIVAVSAPHRQDAFEACRFVIDSLKKTVPIWKEEFYPEGKAWISGE